jgi:hypothetical protein
MYNKVGKKEKEHTQIKSSYGRTEKNGEAFLIAPPITMEISVDD